MNSNSQIFNPILNEKPQVTFIHLKGKIFVQYNIIYHINDGYLIKQLSDVHSKDQLLFQKFNNKMQQMNLTIVDSIFPILLADVALETFLNNVSSFHQYTFLKKKFVVINSKRDIDYFEYKFKSFINYLLYSNIASMYVCKGDLERDYIYYLKGVSKEIEYYSIYEQRELQDLLFQKTKLKINFNNSFLFKEEINLSFQIQF